MLYIIIILFRRIFVNAVSYTHLLGVSVSASMIRYIKFKILEVYSLANIKSAKKLSLIHI